MQRPNDCYISCRPVAIMNYVICLARGASATAKKAKLRHAHILAPSPSSTIRSHAAPARADALTSAVGYHDGGSSASSKLMVEDATCDTPIVLLFDGKDTKKPKCGIIKRQSVSNMFKEGARKRRRQ